MSKLVIVESPSKAKTIEKYLGKDYHVVSSKGHIRDLAMTGEEKLGIDVENGFIPTYVDNDDKKDVIRELKKEIDKADGVLLATDPDREGEAIAWHIADRFGLDLNDSNRVVFNEITKPVVSEAIKHPSKVDMKMVSSQETRRMLDRIIGFKLSGLLQTKIKSKSAGRVQSVALKLIVDREDEINAFKAEEYWTLLASFKETGIAFDAEYTPGKDKPLKNAEQADRAKFYCDTHEYVVTEAKKEIKRRMPKPPYTTSTLQQEASTKLHFGSKQTMRIAQQLYEGVEIASGTTGLITYMRTDSVRLSDVFMAQTREFIVNNYGKEYAGYYRNKTSASAQDAHEAIRPTSIENTPESVRKYLKSDEYRLYKMIYFRALACMMAANKYESYAVKIENGPYEFHTNGKKEIFDGYMKVYGDYESSSDTILPELHEQQVLKAEKLEARQHFTEAPKRYTEAQLIKTMEENGIGRPSTYATIIDTITKRNYVNLEKSSENSKTMVFVPQEQGILTSRMLNDFFPGIINTKYTADMEKKLDDIAEGKQDGVKTLDELYREFEPLLENARKNMHKPAPAKTGAVCPKCGGELVYRLGRYGKFIACSNFPKCSYTERLPQDTPAETGELCPDCGAPLVRRMNRRGQAFIGCSAYPRCSYVKSDGSKPRRFYKKKA